MFIVSMETDRSNGTDFKVLQKGPTKGPKKKLNAHLRVIGFVNSKLNFKVGYPNDVKNLDSLNGLITATLSTRIHNLEALRHKGDILIIIQLLRRQSL